MNSIRITSKGLRPLRFTNQIIRAVVPPRVAGAYLLFAMSRTGLRAIYVGRSDTDLRRRLLTHPHRHSDYFVFEVCDGPERAYQAEAHAFRRLRPKLNRIYPARATAPPGSRRAVTWPVPRFQRTR